MKANPTPTQSAAHVAASASVDALINETLTRCDDVTRGLRDCACLLHLAELARAARKALANLKGAQ